MALDLNAVGKTLKPLTFEYGDREVMLYALGIGAGTDDLDFTFEKNLKVYPTFAVIPGSAVIAGLGEVLTFNWVMLLHGEQRIELKGLIPTSGKLTTLGTVRAIYDKGSGAVVIVDAETKDDAGKVLFVNTVSLFIRGEGGFGGDRGPGGPKNVPPQRAPDATVEMQTGPNQALIYRLSGDRNPLHADPDFAKMAGFDRPILHGLCTFGHAGRAVLKTFCNNDPARLKVFESRFSGVVFPGDTIITEMWKESDSQVILQSKTQRGDAVLGSAAATIAS